MGRGAFWLVVAMVALSSHAQAWASYRGGADRNVLAALPGGRMDVVANVTLLTQDEAIEPFWGAQALTIPEGVLILPRGDACELRVVSFPDLAPIRSMTLGEDCIGAKLVAIAPAAGTVIVCHDQDAESPTIEAIDLATGRVEWSMIAAQAFGAPPTGYAGCTSAAVDEAAGVVYAPLFQGMHARSGVTGVLLAGQYTNARVVALDLGTGAPRWIADIPAAAQTEPLADPGVEGSPDAQPLSPMSITLTSSGLVVTGYTSCATIGSAQTSPAPVCQEAFVAWWDRDGGFHGIERASTGKADAQAQVDKRRAASHHAAALGAIAVTALGNEVVLINPEADVPVVRAPLEAVEPTNTYVFWPTPSWTRERLVVGLPHSLAGLDSGTLEAQWTWTEGLDSRILDMLPTAAGEILVVLHNAATNEIHVVTLAARDGRTLSRLPIRFALEEQERIFWFGQLVVVEEQGIVLVDSRGRAAAIAPRAEAPPALSPDNAFPRPGAGLSIVLPAEEGAREVVVAWGDESVETYAPGALASHAYPTRGDYDVHATTVLADGTTRTSVATIHVGGTPPAELTTLQRAFAPENQEVTFFVLGVMITVFGVVFTVGRQRRRFSRLERELEAVEEIRMMSVADPRAAVLALKIYRARLPEDLARRRIGDSQYHVLDVRSARLLRVLRTRMLAPWDAKLSGAYHRLLDAAFEDAVLTPAEERALLEALQREPLDEMEREGVAAVLRDFTTAREE